MPLRPLVFVSGLTFGDYLLWNWSLNSSHDVLALVSGLTLPPLAVACIWLFALTIARLLARSARHPSARLARARGQRSRSRSRSRSRAAPAAVAASAEDATASGTATAASGASSRKIAA